MKPTYDELLQLVQELREKNKQLKERIQKLEERLNLDSQNSSRPPSSDQKKNKQAPKGGARKGHTGHYRQL
jgi:BMFP domain-containing protein YqiC